MRENIDHEKRQRESGRENMTELKNNDDVGGDQYKNRRKERNKESYTLV
jgi:hypothetical protein